MASANSFLLLVLVAFFTVLSNYSSLIHAATGNGGGFSVEFMHRDSPRSPFYNPLESDYDRLKRSIRRSMSRLNGFKASSTSTSAYTDAAKADVLGDGGEYLMNVSIGTPPTVLLGIADTGSDLIWTQCEPCNDCYKQELPIFDPKSSSSYRELSCTSPLCSALPRSSCNGSSGSSTCQYSYAYGDRSFTRGALASETFTFDSTSGRPIALPKIAFGCGVENGGTFSEKGSGLIGLGGGSLSLISQMADQINGKFSYCLAPFSSKKPATSTLNFGSNGVVSGSGVVSTPIVKGEQDTFFYLTLEGVSVGNNTKIAYSSSNTKAFGDVGNIIIDSGTTLTYLPSDFYNDVESQVKDAIDLQPMQGSQGLQLCYSTEREIDIPTITAHFKGADVVLNPINTFVALEEGVVCLAFVPADTLAIFGNIAQINTLVGYDLEAETVSFKPTDCTKH